MKKKALISIGFAVLLFAILFSACAPTYVVSPESIAKSTGKSPSYTQKPYTIKGKTYYPITSADGYREKGIASWYGKQFHGRKTSNGETYNMYAMTAAHKTLPMNTMVLVRNLDNGQEAVVRVNDRGPFVRGRIIDLSYKAANEINMVRKGTAKIEIIAMGESTRPVPKGGKPGKLRHPDFFKGNFFVQVGSFLNKRNAETVARLLMITRLKTRIQPYITDGHTYYRVQVAAGETLALARILEKQLMALGYQGAFIFAQ